MNLSDSAKNWDKLSKALALPTEKYSLEHFPKFDPQTFLTFLAQDKKKVERNLRLVLVKKIGSCYVEEVPLKDFKAKIQSHDEFKHS